VFTFGDLDGMLRILEQNNSNELNYPKLQLRYFRANDWPELLGESDDQGEIRINRVN
jgi:hypothetical protein